MHLTKDDRHTIENNLNNNVLMKQISKIVNKHPSSISREIRNHYITKHTGSVGKRFNNCLYRKVCPNRDKNCKIKNCVDFVKEKYPLLKHFPYVCNGCKRRTQYTLSKKCYDTNYAQEEYKDTLKESRSGVVIMQEEVEHLNNILTPLIKEKGQSIHRIVINNKNKIMFSEKKIYKLIDLGLLKVRNIDLPRKIRFRQRKKETTVYKVDKNCIENRTYEVFLKYMEETPNPPL